MEEESWKRKRRVGKGRRELEKEEMRAVKKRREIQGEKDKEQEVLFHTVSYSRLSCKL